MSAVLPVYRRSDITIVRGEGVYLFADNGTRYLDFASGIAVNALGHCHPHVVAALKEQSEKLWHCSNMYQMPGLSGMASRLTAACFADKVFFCNSGGEAVEAGLKMLRRFHYVSGQPQKNRIITFEGGFHGRTLACISAGGNAIAREGFAPLLEGFDRVAFNDIEAVKTAIGHATAGILIEPIQGEGGVNEASHDFLRGLRELCDAHGLLLFFDEVQCGMGRTGALFAHQQSGVSPDICSTAKGIGNGFPLGACLTTDRVAAAMKPGTHGSTYGSNPLAMAVGNAVLDVMLQPGFFEHVSRMGAMLKAGLEALAAEFPQMISGVRGRGLMLGLKPAVPAMALVEKLRANQLLTSPAEGGVIRIVPPLTVQPEHVQEALAILRHTCKEGL